MKGKMKPGDLDGRRGDSLRRFSLDGCVWHEHLQNKEYRCKVVGEELWPVKEGETIDPASIRTVHRREIVGRELVSTMEHWWLDKEIKRPALHREDWDFSSLKDSRCDWQLPWAWQYECLREWQPWSDFDLWREDWRKEVKRLRDSENDWICGRRSRQECEESAGFHSRLPLWLLRDFADDFPKTPWAKISHKRRNALKDVPPPGSGTVPLDGSVLSLKEPDPTAPGMPQIPEKLRIQHDGWHSLRQPDPKNAEEMALYTEWQQKNSEALQHHREWLDAPGRYQNEVVTETSPGHFHGTYVIHVPWYCDNDTLDKAWVAWRERHAPKGRVAFKPKYLMKKEFSWLRQLGAIRLLRTKSPDDAVQHTRKYLRDPNGSAYSLFADGPRLERAAKMADNRLAQFWGMA